jgi:hypothetical protein
VVVNDYPLKDFRFQSKYFPPDIYIKKIGLFIILKTKHFMIKWDGATRVYLKAQKSLMGRMKGLCGNYDGDATNDKM